MKFKITMDELKIKSPTQASLAARSPRCDTCSYVMPSYTASTGLRCGLEYSRASALMRKLRPMDFYPTVKADNACELWIAEQTQH